MGARIQAGANHANTWGAIGPCRNPSSVLNVEHTISLLPQPLGSPQHKELFTKQLASSTQEKGRKGRQAGTGWARAPGKLGPVIFSILIREGGSPPPHQVNVSATGRLS